MAMYKTFSETISTGNNTHQVNSGSTDTTVKTILIYNDGPGDIEVELDMNDGNFGQPHTMKNAETIEVRRQVNLVRVSFVSESASYRIFAY